MFVHRTSRSQPVWLFLVAFVVLLAARDWHCGVRTHYCAEAAPVPSVAVEEGASTDAATASTLRNYSSPTQQQIAEAGPAASLSAAAGASLSSDSVFSSTPNEYCCCSTRAVEDNSKPLLDLLNRIVERPFFRIFRVNVKRECSYWAVNTICSLRHNPCAVCRCNMDDVPVAFRSDGDMGVLPDDWNSAPIQRKDLLASSASEEDVLHLRHEQFLSPQSWNGGAAAAAASSSSSPNRHGGGGVFGGGGGGGVVGGAAGMFGAFEDLDAEFFDLKQNPEGYTGYQGRGIWDAIYNENCFQQPAGTDKDQAMSGPVCSQQHVFYQLLSGLHTSISTHLSIHRGPGPDGEAPPPPCDELTRRVLSKPEYVRNLHIVYQFVLRAVTRAAGAYLGPSLTTSSTPSDHAASTAKRNAMYLGDEDLVRHLQSLFQERLLCSNTFNETKFLEFPAARSLVSDMKRMLHNITTLMDCVACEKCRMWGKLQTIGLATALKIIVQPADASFELTRAEKVSLMNLLRQLTVSVDAVKSTCSRGASLP